MIEVIRFYWGDGETTLPLSTIPEEERDPLRVRHSVVEAHSPEVIKQLAAGRFVAEAWKTGRSLHLILCHPSVGKGQSDGFLLDVNALPRIVLRIETWDQARDVSRLFLRAFGADAANANDCANARRDLVKWLIDNGQSDMATVVKRFQSFPFGVRSDPLEVINTWRHLLVKGSKDQIDSFLKEVARRFAGLGFSGGHSLQSRLSTDTHQMSQVFCWVSDSNSRPRTLICLDRATERRIRGGPCDAQGDRTSVVDLAREIQHVLAEVLEPAAATVGLEVSYPHIGPISRVGPNTLAKMIALSDATDGQWPLPPHLEPLWKSFVFTAFRDEVAISPDELTDWHIASGWNRADAIKLTNRFYCDIALIADFGEVGRQPA